MFGSIKKKLYEAQKQAMKQEFKDELDNLRRQIERDLEDERHRVAKEAEMKRLEIEKQRLSSDSKIDEIKKSVELDNEEIKNLEARVSEKKKELASVNRQLQEQISVMEAKSSPSGIWVQAFTLGFSKAWDLVVPILTQGMKDSSKVIRDKAIKETIDRMRPALERSNNGA